MAKSQEKDLLSSVNYFYKALSFRVSHFSIKIVGFSFLTFDFWLAFQVWSHMPTPTRQSALMSSHSQMKQAP